MAAIYKLRQGWHYVQKGAFTLSFVLQIMGFKYTLLDST